MDANAIQHKMTIRGVVTPAIIHNSSYFFINLPVYANGLIDAWELIDLLLLREKLSSGWVTTSIPDGKSISVHGLGDFQIEESEWALTPDDLYRRVYSLVQELNPEMTNLYNCGGKTTKKVGRANVSILGFSHKTPIRPRNPEATFPQMLKGKNLSLFYREGELIYLADLRVFEDGTIEVGRVPNPKKYTRDELSQAATAGLLLTEPPLGSRIHIHQFGSFTVKSIAWSTELDQVMLEVNDLIDELNGRPDSLERCRTILDKYLKGPSAALKEKLKVAYESIPEHNRMYIGDMDTKDSEVRMIIYGDQEIEGWSHRAVARARGDKELPTITVPKVELSEHAKKNRAFWDAYSESYQEAHGPQLSSVEPGWGVWQILERELNVLGDVSGKDILELGCGAAQWSNALSLRGARMVALDNSERQLEHAKRIRPAGVEFPLIHASAESVPLPDESFDIIFCDHGAMSFADPYKTIPEAARLLRPGGLLAFSMATPLLHLCLNPKADKIEEQLVGDYFGLRRFESPEGAIDFQLSYGDWIRLFVANGLIVEDLIELQPKEGATTTYKDYVPLEWARRWPAEHIWRLKRRPALK